MPRRKEPVLNVQTARDIFNELDLYAQDKQFYPVQGALFSYMTKPQRNPMTKIVEPARYPDLKLGVFNHWFNRLVEEGYIQVDRVTRAIRCVHLAIVEKDADPLA